MITIKPTDLNGNIIVPASKSELIRALLFSILNDNEVIIENINFCDDVKAAIAIVESFKIISQANNRLYLKNKDLNCFEFDCGESALISRMLPPILALKLDKFTINGIGSLLNRKIAESYKLFEQFGIKTKDTKFPFHFEAGFRPNHIIIDEIFTSQTISGLFAALPLLEKDSSIRISNRVSSPYLELTIKMLEKHGIKIIEDQDEYYIKGKQMYKYSEIKISFDSSSAAFLYALSQFHNQLKYKYFNNYKLTLDFEFLTSIYYNNQFNTSIIDIQDNPDLFFILIILAAAQKKTIEIKSIDRLINKESNRLQIGINLLKLIDCDYTIKDNSIFVGNVTKLPDNLNINANNDHRVVMATVLLSYVFDIRVTFEGERCISKSYPYLFADLKKCGAEIIE